MVHVIKWHEYWVYFFVLAQSISNLENEHCWNHLAVFIWGEPARLTRLACFIRLARLMSCVLKIVVSCVYMRRQASWPACRDLITEARLLKHIDSKMQIFLSIKWLLLFVGGNWWNVLIVLEMTEERKIPERSSYSVLNLCVLRDFIQLV